MEALEPQRAGGWHTYAGLLMIALSTTTYEILLTRIFSVLLYYHLAFAAISLAMFGMTTGAIVVYLKPDWFSKDAVPRQLSLNSFLFAATTVISLLLINYITGITTINRPEQLTNWMLSVFLLTAAPFVFSGIVVCTALTKVPQNTGKLYAADLIGASLGCIFIVGVLQWFDPASTVFLVGGLAALAAAIFSFHQHLPRLRILNWILAGGFIAGAAINSYLAHQDSNPVRLLTLSTIQRPLYERWNSFSRVMVQGQPDTPHAPDSWGLSSVYPPEKKINELGLYIDSSAYTMLTQYTGDPSKVDHLKYDATNLAHYLRPSASVLVVGVGGGRDILSALIFNQKQIRGVEINDRIISALKHDFGDYTGHLDRYPQVQIVNDEARSYLARTQDKFDILQISLIDTSAATAAGAFVFTENSLYTSEAFSSFIDHLTPTGVLSISRWYSPEHPLEVYRLVALASEALRKANVQSPAANIAIVVKEHGGSSGRRFDGIATMLVSKTPFTKNDLDTLQKLADEMQFKVLLSPAGSADPRISQLASGIPADVVCKDMPVDVTPPRDDRPFYFFFLRFQDLANPAVWGLEKEMGMSAALSVLGNLVIVVSVLTVLCIFLPLLLSKRKVDWGNSTPLLLFFASIGFAFMLVEVAQMQRLIILLGHPVYGLAVVLFTLLLSSGIGSYSTSNVAVDGADQRQPMARLLLLLLVVTALGFLTPYLVSAFQASALPVRVFVTVTSLFPAGIFMGMAFPIGMGRAQILAPELTAWLWGVNGATSIYASVLATAISLAFGISATFFTGCAFYAVALSAYFWSVKDCRKISLVTPG